MSTSTLTIAAGLAWMLATAPQASAQTSIQPALDLYASASYDEALQALDAARQTTLSSEDRVAVEQHRMLCLMALGRTPAAEGAAAALLEAQPDVVLSASDASPRVRAMFDATRRRVLPALTRRFYTDAKRAYDAGDFDAARDGFARVSTLLADPQLAAADPALDDLRTLAEGFEQLAVGAAARQKDLAIVRAAMAAIAPAPVEPTAERAVDLARVPVVMPPAAPPFAPIDIFTYDWRDKDVVPPTVVDQPISGWWGAMGEPAAGTRLGAVDLVVDEHGQVTDAYIYQSVNRVYDTVLLQSAKQWRFRPATKDGRPVKYRRVTGVVSSAGTR